jgi:hypothetical protein
VVLVAIAAAGIAGFWLGHKTVAPVVAASVAAPSTAPIVAHWRGGELTADALRERVLAQKSAAGLAQLDPQRARSFADAVMQAALLATEARQRGLEKDEKVQARTAEALALRLMELEIDDPAKAAQIDDNAVNGYYEQHRAEFERPEKIRVSVSGASMSLARQELDTMVGPKAAEKIWLMVKVGESSAPVKLGDGGTAVFKLEGRESGANLTKEQAAPLIRSRLWYERRDNELRKLVAALQAKLGFSVDDKLLQQTLAELR